MEVRQEERGDGISRPPSMGRSMPFSAEAFVGRGRRRSPQHARRCSLLDERFGPDAARPAAAAAYPWCVVALSGPTSGTRGGSWRCRIETGSIRSAVAATVVTVGATGATMRPVVEASGSYSPYDPQSQVVTIGGDDNIALFATEVGPVLMWAPNDYDPVTNTWYQWLPCAHNGKFVTLDVVSRIDVQLTGERTYFLFFPTAWWDGKGDAPKQVYSGLAHEEIRAFGPQLRIDVSGGPDDDRLRAGAGGIDIDGDDHLDLLTTLKPVQIRFFGNGGNDVIDGRSSDALTVSASGGEGNDMIYGTARGDDLSGGNGTDVLVGGSGNDRLDGDGDDDRLYGGQGNDELTGWGGHDFLDAGRGFRRDCQQRPARRRLRRPARLVT